MWTVRDPTQALAYETSCTAVTLYRLQLFDLAGRTTVAQACRTFGVHRSTYYRWKDQVERSGLEMLRPRERRAPRMPNQFPAVVEERIVAFSLGHAGLGPKRIAAQLRRSEWGGLQVSPNGVYKVLVRHGLNTRKLRLALIAGYRAPDQLPAEPAPEPHIDTGRPGELVGFDCFFVGRLHGTKGAVWQLTAIDTYSSFAWAELVRCQRGDATTRAQTSRLATRSRPGPANKPAGVWSGCSADNGNEFQRRLHRHHRPSSAPITAASKPGRPQTNGHVERLHRTILEECWRPAFARYLEVALTAACERELRTTTSTQYNWRRAHTGRITAGR